MGETLYHAEIGFPDWFVAPTFMVSPTYSRHALTAAVDDGLSRLPRRIILGACEVIEIGVEDGRVSKILFRMKYTPDEDLCLVIIPGKWFVKTIWMNRNGDRHATLDRSRYAVP